MEHQKGKCKGKGVRPKTELEKKQNWEEDLKAVSDKSR